MNIQDALDLHLKEEAFRIIGKEKTKFSPFSATTLQSYQDQYGVKVAKVDVQRTLEEFRKEGLVVRIGHGQWILDDVNPKWLSAYQISTAQPGPLP